MHPKQRLVTLAALLHAKAVDGRREGGDGGKLVVFLSTCAGVDFHHTLLSSAAPQQLGIRLPCKLFKLHGNLSQVGLVACSGVRGVWVFNCCSSAGSTDRHQRQE